MPTRAVIVPPISPVPDILCTNQTPSLSQTGAIKNSVSIALTGLSRVESNIAALQAVMDGLQQERGALQKFADEHTALITLTGIRRIPDEILSEIFIWCLPASWTDGFAFCRYTRRYISQVCQRWRMITFSLPRLWALLAMKLRAHKPRRLEARTAETWLQRSGLCTLSLAIEFSESENYKTNVKEAHPILGVITRLAFRWREARLSITASMLKALAEIHPHLHTPCLQILSLNRDPIDCGYWEGPVVAFQHAPLLSSVELGRDIELRLFRFPFIHLTTFRSRDIIAHDALEMLRQTPILDQCDIRINCNGYPNSTEENLIVSQLKSLVIGFQDYEADDFLDHISLPLLCDLKLKFNLSGGISHGLISLFKRSQNPLKTLTLDYNIPELDLIEILRSAPSIVELNLSCQLSIDVIVSHLTNPIAPTSGSPTSLVPKLKAFRFTYSGKLRGPGFASMVYSRWNSHGLEIRAERLSVVEISFSTWSVSHEVARSIFDEAAIRCLRQCRDEGLDIYFKIYVNDEFVRVAI